MSLLLQPPRLPDEGPAGYRFRLASVNMISVRQLADLEQCGVLDEDGGSFGRASQDGDLDGLSVWVRRWSRFCPGCVAALRTWQLSWEVLFADACVRCGMWLVDRCSRCESRLDWRRDDLHRCACGQVLAAEPGRPAPSAVVRLSRALAGIAKEEPLVDPAMLAGLSLEQCIRLVRLLGAYGTWDGRSAPQKIPNIDRLDVSWPISSCAAEVLFGWPEGMTTLLERLKRVGRGEDSGRLGQAFGGFYTAVYNAFGGPEFAFLRNAFEGYVAERWTGPVARRNRRLDGSVLDALAWMPANHACRALDVSRRRLNQLVDDGHLCGERRLSAGGRQFLIVLKSDVARLAPTVNEGLSLVAVADRLGLKRQRLAALLPTICPDAVKTGAVGCPWSIPVGWVERWECLLRAQPELLGADGHVSIGHLLRYWPWTDEQVGQLLADICDGGVTPMGVTTRADGVGALLLELSQAREWFAARHKVQPGEMTIPEVATKMEVKQEVAYALVRSGLLGSAARRVGRRAEQRVSSLNLHEFGLRYVFCRDLALKLGRSPRAVSAFLASEGVKPVAGPGFDDCRQLVFSRAAVDGCLQRTGVAPAQQIGVAGK